jgi:hypothetical protein
VFRRLPETPLPPPPIPFELAHPTRQPPPAPVVTGQIGLIGLMVNGALVLHASLVVAACLQCVQCDRHSDQHHEQHEHARPVLQAALRWLIAHAPTIAPGRRRFLHHRAALRQQLATSCQVNPQDPSGARPARRAGRVGSRGVGTHGAAVVLADDPSCDPSSLTSWAPPSDVGDDRCKGPGGAWGRPRLCRLAWVVDAVRMKPGRPWQPASARGEDLRSHGPRFLEAAPRRLAPRGRCMGARLPQ